MEIQTHCTVLHATRIRNLLGLLLLGAGVLFTHGFHPWAEDGGLYAATVELALDPRLFPRDRPFVTVSAQYSLFAEAVAALVRFCHEPLGAVLFGLYLVTTVLMLWGGLRIARCCFPGDPGAQWAGVCLLAAWWTLPVAGTSLLLMDPYLTARSVSTPLSLLTISEILRLQPSPTPDSPASSPNAQVLPRTAFRFRSAKRFARLRILLLLTATAAFHPLMAIHLAFFSLVLLLALQEAKPWVFALLSGASCGLLTAIQWHGAPEGRASQLAVASRYYWFLSRWHGYEWLGLFGPLGIYGLLLLGRRRPSANLALRPDRAVDALCRSSLFVGLLGMAISLLLVQEHFAGHTVARLQPLRCFLPLYALLPLLLAGSLMQRFAQRRRAGKSLAILPWAAIAANAAILFAAQRATFPGSSQIEWPGSTSGNAWVQAFLWAKVHAPPATLFALDAHYVNRRGEDAQSFRALAEHSMVPDYSKDGGVAANHPDLASAWLRGAEATFSLDQVPDSRRDPRLRTYGELWMVLPATTPTLHSCPYRNQLVKICLS